jgi:hypothetical protein
MFLQRIGHFTLGEVISDHNDTHNLVKLIAKDILWYIDVWYTTPILCYIRLYWYMITYVFPGGTKKGENIAHYGTETTTLFVSLLAKVSSYPILQCFPWHHCLKCSVCSDPGGFGVIAAIANHAITSGIAIPKLWWFETPHVAISLDERITNQTLYHN